MRGSLAVVLSLTIASLAGAQTAAAPRDEMLISTASLGEHLRDPNLVLLHIGDEKDYHAKHLAGARLVQLDDISDSDHSGAGLMLEMPSADRLRDKLAALGISDNSRIVIYYADDWVSSATRLYFTLDHAGLADKTRLLDGSMQQWIREGRAVTANLPPNKTGTLSALHLKPKIVDANYVKAHVGKAGFSVVDGRAASFYDGVQTGQDHDGRQRAGHVAGAKSVPFTSPYDNANRLLSPTELVALFTKAGIAPTDTVVGYCHIGQQATAMLFAARSLGHPILLYDGSFEDWSRRPAAEFPVERTPGSK